jgi:hypothetical protein
LRQVHPCEERVVQSNVRDLDDLLAENVARIVEAQRYRFALHPGQPAAND